MLFGIAIPSLYIFLKCFLFTCTTEQHKGYFRSHSSQPLLVMTAPTEHCRKLSQHEKFCKASIITSELASVASEASNVHFQRWLHLLRYMTAHWKNGDEVAGWWWVCMIMMLGVNTIWQVECSYAGQSVASWDWSFTLFEAGQKLVSK